VSPPPHVKVPPEVAALVRGLHPVLKRKVRAALQVILDDPYAGKALCNELQGLRSYRVGRLRIIYRLRRDVELVAIGPRDSIYVETYRRIHEPPGRYRLTGALDTRRFRPRFHSLVVGWPLAVSASPGLPPADQSPARPA